MASARHHAVMMPRRRLLLTTAAAVAALLGVGMATPAFAACPPLLDHTLPRLQDEQPQSLCQQAGKVVLVVNTASYCGYTGQFKGLEALQKRYGARGFTVLGFPSNDFRQEDADAAKTADVCFNHYGVSFPMFAKIDVNGDDTHPLYRWLKTEKSGLLGGRIKWNFTKFLVGRDGQVIERFAPTTTPADLEKDVVAALAAPRP